MIATSTAVQSAGAPLTVAAAVRSAPAAVKANLASFLTSLLEAGGAPEAAVTTPGLLAPSGRKNLKDKDTASKSDTNSGSAVAPVPVPSPLDSPPLLLRLLQFGLIIEPRTAEPASAGSVDRSSGSKTAPAIASNSGGAEDVQPQTATSAPNLAFAMRLTDSSAPAADAAPSLAAQPSSDTKIEPAVSRTASPAPANPIQATPPVQPAQQSGNQTGTQDSNRNPKQERDQAAVTATPAATLPAAASTTSTVITSTPTAPAPAISQPPVKDAAPVAHTAPAAEVADKPAAAPAQRITLSVSDSQNQRVDVHLMERGGEVRVSVRTADEGLTHSMRADLGSLSGKLAQSGYNTESFAPAGANTSSFSNQRESSEGRDSAGGNRQNPQQGHSGGQQQQSRDGRGQRPAWVDELENSLASNAAIRSNQPWQRA